MKNAYVKRVWEEVKAKNPNEPEFLQAVEEGAGPMMGTIDVMGGLGRNPADALLTRALRMRRGGTEVTGGHADRVFDFDAAIGCSQVCHFHTSIFLVLTSFGRCPP